MQGEKAIRILLVTSDGDVLETMRRAFSGAGFDIAGEAWPGIDAARRAGTLTPDVVMFHIEEPIAPAMRTVEAISEACPAAGLAVVSSSLDLETVRRVMNAGAHDFAQLPLADDAIRDAAVRATAASSRRGADAEASNFSASGKVITVAGPRGGVGKTTIATNLALSLTQETGTGVALADLDILFGGAAIGLDMIPGSGVQDWLQERV